MDMRTIIQVRRAGTCTASLLAALLCLPAMGQPAQGFNELGTNYFQQERYEEALERFEQAHRLAPQVPSIRRNICLTRQILARQAFEADRIPEARAHLEAAIAIDPENPAPLVQAGGYLLGSGEMGEARSNLEAALKLDPGHLEAHILLGEICYRDNDFAGARSHWETVLAEKPDWPGLAEKLQKVEREDAVEADFARYTSEHFEIRYGKVLSEETRTLVFELLEAAYRDIGEALGGLYPETIIQVVLYDGNEFAEATDAAPHIGALYDGKIRAPITNRRGRFLTGATLGSRLRHEYVHAVLRDALGAAVPWWLNEGLAETLSRDMDQSRLRLLRTAYRAGDNLPFAELESNVHGRLVPKQLSLAYAQSHVAADALWKLYPQKFPALIAALKAGSPYETALKETLGIDYAELDRRTRIACGAEEAR